MILDMLRRLFFGLVLFIVYLVSTVPVGLFLYSLKSDFLGINIFTKTGFHAYMQCLQEQIYKIEMAPHGRLSNEAAYQEEIEKKKALESVGPKPIKSVE